MWMPWPAGTRNTLSVGIACGIAGIIAGVVTMTGLANVLITAIVQVANGQLIIALFLTMLCCIVLGMGVPTTANYVIMATTCAPILVQGMGMDLMAANFFVFYFGHCGRHHPARGPGRLCRLRHRQSAAYEDGLQRHPSGHRGLHRALHLCFQ